jgi:OmpA-OmpF porin, OOP family
MLRRTALAVAVCTTAAYAQLPVASIPTADRKASKDSPLLKRYEGSFIVAYERKSFGELTLPLSPIEQVEPEKRTQQNNRVFEPKSKKALEGAHTRIAYLLPAERSPLEVLRNYQDEIKSNGGKVLFECKGAECGGDPDNSSGGGGGNMSLAMYLYPPERVIDAHGSNGWCALAENITDQRYTAAELPQSGTHVSVLAYTIVAPDRSDPCLGFNGRTIAVVDIIEAKDREKKMVTVDAGEMAKSIDATGRVALYGIYFDFNKADVKPESDETLEQIAALMKKNATLKLLVVGHTDNIGSFPFNMDLSQRRAAAVVAALISRFSVGKERLTPVGVSFASPVAPNKTDEGRARNRRVELVENAVATGK